MIEPRPAHPFTWTSHLWGRALQSSVLAPVATHLFTTRDLPLRGAGEEDGWARLAASAGVSPARFLRMKQVHGVDVTVIRTSDRRAAAGGPADGRMWPHADVIMTDDPTIAVAVQVADCVPLLLADPVTGAVAAVHSGWRGTAAGVARVAVAAMTEQYGARPDDLLAAIGPSIGACCYQVGGDVLDAFRTAGFPEDTLRAWFRPDESSRRNESPVAQGFSPVSFRYRLDVPNAVVDQLHAAGLAPANITSCGLCTACHPSLFPSYRRDGAHTGRIAGVIRRGGDR